MMRDTYNAIASSPTMLICQNLVQKYWTTWIAPKSSATFARDTAHQVLMRSGSERAPYGVLLNRGSTDEFVNDLSSRIFNNKVFQAICH